MCVGDLDVFGAVFYLKKADFLGREYWSYGRKMRELSQSGTDVSEAG